VAEQGKAQDPISPSIQLYDYDFAIFFKDAYDKIQRQIRAPHKVKRPQANRPSTAPSTPIPASSNSNTSLPVPIPNPQFDSSSGDQQISSNTVMSSSPAKPNPIPASATSSTQGVVQDAVIVSYKELIRAQDRELESFKKENEALRNTISTREADIGALQREILEMRNNSVNASPKGPPSPTRTSTATATPGPTVEEMAALSLAYNELEKLVNSKDDEIERLTHEVATLRSSPVALEDEEEDNAKAELEIQVMKLELETEQIKKQITAVIQERDEIGKQLGQSRTLNTQLQTQIEKMHEKEGKQSTATDSKELRITKLEMVLREQQVKYESLEKEQEELLQCLANTEIENNNLKERLRLIEAKNA